MLTSGNIMTWRYMILQHSSFRNLQQSANKLVLYGDVVSPPVRFVKMTASTLGIDLDFRNVNIFENENRSDSYTKVNPLQKVPALETGENVICDSHAIGIYLCQNYGGQSLYPENPLIKSRINQMLFYNASVLFQIDSAVFTNFFAGQWDLNNDKLKQWTSALDYLEYNLKIRKWLAGDQMHLCDICVVCTVTSMQELVPLTARHANVGQWIKRFEALDSYEINKTGLQRLKSFVNFMKVKQ